MANLSGNGGTIEIGSAEPLTAALVARVDGLCDRLEDGGGTAAVIRLIGADPDTGTGTGTGTGSVASWPEAVGVHLVSKWERALRRTERLRVPTVAVAAGRCTGPALDVLLTVDHRIGTPDLTLRPPGTVDGPWPGMSVHRLVTQIGVARARRLILLGGELSATEALELGILDEVTDDTEAAMAATLTAAGAVPGSELAVRRRLLLDASTVPFDDALGAHLAACDRALRRAAAGQPAPAVPLAG